MAGSDQGPEDDEPYGPDFEVWNHLDGGLQVAHDDMANKLGPDLTALLMAIADGLVELKEQVFIPRDAPAISQKFAEVFPQFGSTQQANILNEAASIYAKNAGPFFRHAVHLAVAGVGLRRVNEALTRFVDISFVIVQRPVPAKSRPYIREVVHTFLFGFDPACIALCRSTFELFARSVLVARGLYTEPQLRREQPTAHTLSARLKQANLIPESHSAATRLVERGNTILHKGIYDARISKQAALDSVSDLILVAQELAIYW
jgi:hypothetical protein